MSIVYNVYSNDGRGGPVNYTTPVATTPGLTFATPPLATPSDNTFAVRAFDTALGLEEANTEACLRIVIDAGGNDVTSRPNAPHALAVQATAGGGCHATWAYITSGQGGPPTGFLVYLTPGTSPAYASPASTIPYIPGRIGYSCDLSGLADGLPSTIAVRAFNAGGAETNTSAIATVIGDATPPGMVDSLTATSTFSSN